MRITIIGSGNVATHLATALKNAGHCIVQVYSRNINNAALLAYHVSAEAIDALERVNSETDIFIVAVKDDAIAGIAEALAPFQKLMVHTSGATALNAIGIEMPLSGVFYPLQTFSKIREVDFSKVPLCVEGYSEDITIKLEQLAGTISQNVYRVSSAQRKILHLAAVFACNFPNHLYVIAQNMLTNHGLDFDMIRPLILETAQKVQENIPIAVQTGPAVRNDKKTMADHEQLLNREPELQLLYQVLSQSIIKMEIPNGSDN